MLKLCGFSLKIFSHCDDVLANNILCTRLKAKLELQDFFFPIKHFFSVFAVWILDDFFIVYSVFSYFFLSLKLSAIASDIFSGAIETKSCTGEKLNSRENQQEIVCKSMNFFSRAWQRTFTSTKLRRKFLFFERAFFSEKALGEGKK